MPWFQEFEPTISWKEKTLEGDVTIQTETKVTESNAATMATTWAINNEKNQSRCKKEEIPKQYEKYQGIFSEE